jgi:hypothetical protein
MKAEGLGDLGSGRPLALGEGYEDAKPHPDIDQMHRVEAAPPFEDLGDLLVGRRPVPSL